MEIVIYVLKQVLSLNLKPEVEPSLKIDMTILAIQAYRWTVVHSTDYRYPGGGKFKVRSRDLGCKSS